MSKSLGNYIGISESPDEQFGKLMSISDELMWRYLELLSFEDMRTIEQWRGDVERGLNPRDVKIRLAKELVTRFHGEEHAERAHRDFVIKFQRREIPADIPVREVSTAGASVSIAYVLKSAGLVKTTSEGMRLIKQGAVSIDGERIEDPKRELAAGQSVIFKVGKRRFARVTVTGDSKASGSSDPNRRG